MSSSQESLFFNGVNGSTGAYLFPELSAEQIAAVARGVPLEPADEAHEQEVTDRYKEQQVGHLGTSENVEDPNDLSQAGWGVILPSGFDKRILEALRPLLDYRKGEAASKNPLFYKEFTDYKGAFRPDDTIESWRERQNIGPGPVDPERGVPYYLLIVGSPAQIPYSFQYQLDVQHAVGRIYFDELEAYRRYAESVVQAEQQGLARPQRVALADVVNGEDRATNLSAKHLVAPLRDSLKGDQRFNGWDIQHAPLTRKAAMAELLGGPRAAPLLFTATHGVGFDPDDPRQQRHQGALLCQEWPGRDEWGDNPIPADFYLSADDIGPDARVWGSIYFHFACYGAGTPLEDDFSHYKQMTRGLGQRPQIATSPFVARLPQRLLGHESGGALAVIGHVDRAWTWSFRWNSIPDSHGVFTNAMKLLMRGRRVGFAMEKFNERYGEVATLLNTELNDIQFGKALDPLALAGKWTANNDAKSYVIIGDPAAKLVFAPDAPPEPPYRVLSLAAAGGPAGAPAEPAPVAPSPAQPAPAQPAVTPAPAAPVAPTTPEAEDFSIFGHGGPAVASRGREIATTLLYVHGTGTRLDGFKGQLGEIKDGLVRYLPEAAVNLAECYWGDHGVDLNGIQAVLPDEEAGAFGGEGDEQGRQEREAARWAALYAAPLAELEALALDARYGQGGDLRGSFAARLAAVPDDRRVAAALAAAQGSPAALTAAAEAVRASAAFQWALGAATHSPEDYALVLARATTATLIAQERRAGRDTPLARYAALRQELVSVLADALSPGGDFGPGGAVLRALATPFLQAATGLVNLDRTRATEGLTPFPGDILRYLRDGEAIRAAVKARIEATRAPIILAHSLGGIVCVDLLAREQLPWVKLLITVGSQAPFLYQLDALPSIRRGDALPGHFPHWLNLYHRSDLLSYLGAKVFGSRVWDREVRSSDPFPYAHGAYWLNRETWHHIAVALRDLGLSAAR